MLWQRNAAAAAAAVQQNKKNLQIWATRFASP
jgi:hypothetical protein